MEEVDLERLVLPALLALLILGAFLILVTSGGGEESLARGRPCRRRRRTAPDDVPAGADGRPRRRRRGRFVKVRPGDTPTSIADRAGFDAERLLELNPSIDPDSLRLGQTLKLAP